MTLPPYTIEEMRGFIEDMKADILANRLKALQTEPAPSNELAVLPGPQEYAHHVDVILPVKPQVFAGLLDDIPTPQDQAASLLPDDRLALPVQPEESPALATQPDDRPVDDLELEDSPALPAQTDDIAVLATQPGDNSGNDQEPEGPIPEAAEVSPGTNRQPTAVKRKQILNSGPYMTIPMWMSLDRKYSRTDLAVVGCLIYHLGANGSAFPSIATLDAEVGASSRAVASSISKISEMGLFIVGKRNTRDCQVNTYTPTTRILTCKNDKTKGCKPGSIGACVDCPNGKTAGVTAENCMNPSMKSASGGADGLLKSASGGTGGLMKSTSGGLMKPASYEREKTLTEKTALTEKGDSEKKKSASSGSTPTVEKKDFEEKIVSTVSTVAMASAPFLPSQPEVTDQTAGHDKAENAGDNLLVNPSYAVERPDVSFCPGFGTGEGCCFHYI